MVGFILMLDAFRSDNGATGFIPGSHRRTGIPTESGSPNPASSEARILACGPPGSMIVFNGSIWHGFVANSSAAPRRSLQGAYIRRDEKPAMDWPSRVPPATAARMDPIAKYLLEL
jgi:ectoine hydroxylase-related dioxygenase (phytanoyl-CoA dioxygenase family)